MSITDTGFYFAPFPNPQYELRDIIVWPPGWELPGATETVTLDAPLSVGVNGAVIAGYFKSAGELWVPQTSATWSHRVGFVPASAAGSYVAGNTVPMYRFPRFIAPNRTSRGSNSPTLSNPNTRPTFPGLSEIISTYQRNSGTTIMQMVGATSQFVIGDLISIGGIADKSFNGKFVINGISGGGFISYINSGGNVGTTAALGARCAIQEIEAISRIHQFAGLTSWTHTTGPSPGVPDAAAPFYGPLVWNYNGVRLQQVLFMAEPYDRAYDIANVVGQSFRRTIQVWAPIAAETCRDFAVNANLPVYGSIRVVWVDGIPQCSHPSGITAPYAGATRTGRQRGHTDRLTSVSSVVFHATIPEDAGRVRSISSLGIPQTASGVNGATRGDLFGAMWFRPWDSPTTSSGTPFSAVTVTGQWMRRRVNGADVTFGSSFSIAFSILTFGADDYLCPNDNAVPAPSDGTYGLTPGSFYLQVSYGFTTSGSPNVIVNLYNFQGFGGFSFCLRSSAIMPPLNPWPYDVPKVAFGADDAAVQYVGHPGWLMAPCVYPVATVVPPTLGRAGTTITATPGSCSISPSADGLVNSSRGVLIRAIAKAVNAGDSAGSNGTSGTQSVTVAAFSGQPVDAEANDVWTATGSHVGGAGPVEHFSGKLVQNLP